MHRYLLALLITLVSCTTPQEQCVARSTKEMRVIDKLIATTKVNIERGYAMEYVETRNPVSVGLFLCASPSVHMQFCADTHSAPRKKPVAIDQADERRKLAQLKGKRAELQRQANAKTAACRAAQSN